MDRNTNWRVFFSFLLANSPMTRTKIIGLLKCILVFTLRIVQYIEIENNYPGVSNRGKLRFHHLKSNKDSAPYSCVIWILFYFQEILFLRCPSFMSYQLSQHKKYFFSHQKQKSLKNFYPEIEISNFFLLSQKAEILPQYPVFFVYLRFQQTCLWRFSALKEKNKIVYFSFVLNVIVKQFKGIVMQII